MRNAVVLPGLSCSLAGPLAIASLALFASGCLESRGRFERVSDTHVDTTVSEVTTGGEVGETTPPDVDLCAGRSCEDGNPCTADWCNPATGQCEQVPETATVPAEPPECTSDAECDDHNACTYDSCSRSQCSNGGWCSHAWMEGCQVGCAGGCDDHDPCTDDECIADSCEHAALDACDPQCSSMGLVSVSEARNVFWGTFVKARGTVQMANTNFACTDDGLCNCWGLPALVGYQAELALYAAIQDEPVMSCRSHDGAPQQIACEPMAVGVDYRVWGTGGGVGPIVNGADPAPHQPAPAPIQGIAVQGYCLESADFTLMGHYKLFFERWGQTVELEAEMLVDEPGWLYLHVTGALSEGGPVNDAWSVLEVLDNGVRFKLDVTFDDGPRTLIARVVSHGNELTGRWASQNYAAGPLFTLHGPAAGDAPSAWVDGPDGAGAGASDVPAGAPDPYFQGGTLRFVRLPGDAPRSPCASIP